MRSETEKYFRWRHYPNSSTNHYVRFTKKIEITCDGEDQDCKNGKCEHIKKILKKIHPMYRRGLK